MMLSPPRLLTSLLLAPCAIVARPRHHCCVFPLHPAGTDYQSAGVTLVTSAETSVSCPWKGMARTHLCTSVAWDTIPSLCHDLICFGCCCACWFFWFILDLCLLLDVSLFLSYIFLIFIGHAWLCFCPGLRRWIDLLTMTILNSSQHLFGVCIS